jgi:DNA adenine methylase
MSLLETFGEEKSSMTAILDDSKPKPLNSPFKWVGGKSRLRKYVIELLPEHTCYLELFAGAAWVLFGKPLSNVEIINDIDQDLVTFFRVVREKPEELIASFDWELASRAEFERLAELDASELTDIQRAHRFYYLIMAGWGGELHYPRFQTSITDGGHGNRLIGALTTLRQRLEPVHDRLRTVIIENLDWQRCFERYDRSGTVMYIDPPYPGNKCNYAHNMRGWPEHHLLADRLKNAKCQWILSSYDIPEMHALFSDYFILAVQSASGMSAEKNGTSRTLNRELLITNYAPPKSLLRQTASSPAQPALELEAGASYNASRKIASANLMLLNSPSGPFPPASLLK